MMNEQRLGVEVKGRCLSFTSLPGLLMLYAFLSPGAFLFPFAFPSILKFYSSDLIALVPFKLTFWRGNC